MTIPPSLHVDARKAKAVFRFNMTSRMAGQIADLPLPPALLQWMIRAYAAKYDVPLDEAKLTPDGFKTFGDFFARELKPGLRPVDPDPGTLTSPADGLIQTMGTIHAGLVTQIKGQEYRVADLLKNADLAAQLEGGQFVTVYLSPRDYHRVHAPTAGEITAAWSIPGALYSVSPIFVQLFKNLFVTNERLVVSMDTPRGLVVVVLVAAAVVGKAVLSFSDLATNQGRKTVSRRFEPSVLMEKGEELGAFRLGSTVVVLTEKGWTPNLALLGEKVKMGQPIMEALP